MQMQPKHVLDARRAMFLHEFPATDVPIADRLEVGLPFVPVRRDSLPEAWLASIGVEAINSIARYFRVPPSAILELLEMVMPMCEEAFLYMAWYREQRQFHDAAIYVLPRLVLSDEWNRDYNGDTGLRNLLESLRDVGRPFQPARRLDSSEPTDVGYFSDTISVVPEEQLDASPAETDMEDSSREQEPASRTREMDNSVVFTDTDTESDST